MTEPVDPNEPPHFEPPTYEPPPATAPPPYPPYQPTGGQPAGGQPSYPPPPYPSAQPPGGQSSYPPPPYPSGTYQGGYSPYAGAQPGGWPGPDGAWPPFAPPPSHRRRNVLIAVAVAIVLVAAGVGGFFLLHDDKGSSAKAGKTPSAFAGYTLLDNSAASRVKKAMIDFGHTMGGTAGRIFDSAAIGVYSHDTGDQPVLITVTLPTSAGGPDQTPDSITRGLLSQAAGGSNPFPAGSHGGNVRCGLTQFGAVSETMCAWSDNSKSGLLVSVNESLQPADLAQLTLRFRDAAE